MQNAAAFKDKCGDCLFRDGPPQNDSGPSVFLDTCRKNSGRSCRDVYRHCHHWQRKGVKQ